VSTTFDEWISALWAVHDTESARVAGELEARLTGRLDRLEEAAQLTRALRVSNHTIGNHLHDWPRARRVAEAAVASRRSSDVPAVALMHVATAQYLDGATSAALTSETAALARAREDPLYLLISARLLILQALVAEQRCVEAVGLFEALLALVSREAGGVALQREVAMACNNLASDLLEQALADESSRNLMSAAASAALHYWSAAGTWQNEERALYLCALVENRLGAPAKASEHAQRALAVIAANGDEPVDEAFLHLALAHAGRLSGAESIHTDALARARAIAAQFSDAALSQWYRKEEAKVLGARAL
jgi:hypothetical protein